MKSADQRKAKNQPTSIFGEILNILEEAIPASDRSTPRALLSANNRSEDGQANEQESSGKSTVPSFETNSRLWAGLGMTALASAVLFFGSRNDSPSESASSKTSGFKGWLLQTARLVAGAGAQSLFAHVFSTAPSAKLIAQSDESDSSEEEQTETNDTSAHSNGFEGNGFEGAALDSREEGRDETEEDSEDLGSPRKNGSKAARKRGDSSSSRTLS